MRRLIRRLPQPWRVRLQRLRDWQRGARYRLRERVRPVVVTQSQVEAALREAGVEEGDTVLAQAAMSSFGSFEGGPRAVIDALDAVVGPQGTVVMPAFPMRGLSAEHVRDHPVFDSRTDPSRMGAISERFRTEPGTARSLHPTHSLSVRGPGAEAFTAGHEDTETPFGPDTPFGELLRRNAKQLYMGTSVRPLTMYHAFECHRRSFPYSVFLPERKPATVVAADGSRKDITTLVHRPVLAPGRIDFNPGRERLFRRELLAGGMKRVPLGRDEILCQPMADMFQTFERLLARDETMYDPSVLAGLRVTDG